MFALGGPSSANLRSTALRFNRQVSRECFRDVHSRGGCARGRRSLALRAAFVRPFATASARRAGRLPETLEVRMRSVLFLRVICPGQASKNPGGLNPASHSPFRVDQDTDSPLLSPFHVRHVGLRIRPEAFLQPGLAATLLLSPYTGWSGRNTSGRPGAFDSDRLLLMLSLLERLAEKTRGIARRSYTDSFVHGNW